MADWKEVTIDNRFRLRSPVPLSETAATGVDSNASALEGPNLNVVIDEGQFSDPLTAYGSRQGAHVSEEPVGGHPARVVSFPLDDGSQFAAAHFELGGDAGSDRPRKLTISVTGRDDAGGKVPLEVVRSLEFL
jgi:hypothetical protein